MGAQRSHRKDTQGCGCSCTLAEGEAAPWQGLSSCLQPQVDASVSIPAGPWLEQPHWPLERWECKYFSKQKLRAGGAEAGGAGSCSGHGPSCAAAQVCSDLGAHSLKVSSSLCLKDGAAAKLQQLPFPFMQRAQEQNCAGAVSELRAAPQDRGHNAQGKFQDTAVPLPHQPWALQSPLRTSPKHHDIPKSRGFVRSPERIWFFHQGSRETPGIIDQVTVPLLSEFTPRER